MGIIGRYKGAFAILMTVVMIVPAIPALCEDARASNIIHHMSTLGDGSSGKIVSFSTPGRDSSLFLSILNGAHIVSATMNVSGLPYTTGEKDYPENVSLDIGNDSVLEWAFIGKGYGCLGKQYYVSNATNSADYIKVPFNTPGTDNSLKIRLPKNATVTSASLNLTPGGIVTKVGTVTQMQHWAPGQWNGQGASMMMDELNGNILYDSIQFNLAAIPDGVNVFNATLWWGRNGLGNYETMGGYSFADPIGVYQILEQWTAPIQKVFTETSPAESVNMAVNKNVYYPWTVTNMTRSWVLKQSPNYGLNLHRTVAADRDKWDYVIQTPYIDVEYGRPANVSLKLMNNPSNIFSQTGPFDNPVTVPDFSAMLNEYLANNPPTVTDAYGNEIIDVPLTISTTDMGAINVSNLAVIYQYCATVDINPDTGSLAESINALLPKKSDGKTSKIPIAISSDASGRVKVTGISIDYNPPDHYANIVSWTPEDYIVKMNENQTIEFSATASDQYDFPLNVTWKLNNNILVKDQYNMSWYADFNANGTYNVSVYVNNQLHDTVHSWLLIVQNFNRKPVIDSFDPDKKFEMDENSTATFTVTASDPDKDVLSYAWYIDGKRATGEDSFFEYRTTYSSAGKHEVKVQVWDAASASTVMAWNVTVNGVNAAPEITDSSPPVDEVAMNENSAKKFTVTDLSIDGDKHVISWYVDGNSTGATGRSYEYLAGYDSAGRHEVAAEVSDGKLSARRTWYVTVADVNRPPAAVISAPAAGAEFMLGEEITLDGTQSSDPDGDQLTMTWSEGQKTLGTGVSLAVKLSKGKHSITLRIVDGGKNGTASATVQITVRYLDFSGKLTVDTETPVEGQKIILTAVLSNRGDGSIDELPVSFRVDGTEVSTTTIESIGPDSDFPLEFQWKAVKGDHKLEVSVNNQNFTKLVTVAKKPAAATPGGDMLLPLLAIAIVVVIALAAGAALYAGRKKRAAAQSAEEAEVPEEQGVPEEPEKAVPYKPIRKATAAAAERPAPVPAPAAAPAAPQAPVASDEARAREAIEGTEKALQDAEKVGLDTTRARQVFKIARNFHGMGRHQKAIEFCKKAEDSIE